MSRRRGTTFHYRYKRYLRQMMRRYPKMRLEMLGVCWGSRRQRAAWVAHRKQLLKEREA